MKNLLTLKQAEKFTEVTEMFFEKFFSATTPYILAGGFWVIFYALWKIWGRG